MKQKDDETSSKSSNSSNSLDGADSDPKCRYCGKPLSAHKYSRKIADLGNESDCLGLRAGFRPQAGPKEFRTLRGFRAVLLMGGLMPILLGAIGAPSLSAQTCTQPFVLRQETCPSGISTCTTKGSTLTFTELDRDIINTVTLCNGPGKFTWPATGSAGIFAVTSGGAVSIAVDDDVPDTDAEILDAHTMNGGTITASTLSGTNTVTGTLNLNSATQGNLRFPAGLNLPGTCTIGDSYWDTDADSDGSFFVCRATNTWKDVDDDGGAGGGAPTDATYLTLGTNATLTNERVYTTGVGLNGLDSGAGSAFTISFWTGDTLAANPTYSTEDVVFTKDGSGGGLLWEGVTADTIEGILVWNPDATDKTITLPNVSGIVITSGDTGSVSATLLSSDSVTESKLDALDSPADEECITYEATGGRFEYQTCGGGGGTALDTLGTPEMFDEFCGRSTGANVYGSLNWTAYGSNGGGTAMSELSHPCVQNLFTTTVSGNIQSFGLAKLSTDDNFLVADLDRAVFVIKTGASVANIEIRVGFMNDVNSTNGGDGFMIELDTSVSTAWNCITRNSGTSTTTASGAGAVAANTWYQLELERTSGGNYNCYANGVNFAIHTTNIPTTVLNTGFVVETKEALQKILYIDYFRYKGKAVTRF
jgi:hypothetical protein